MRTTVDIPDEIYRNLKARAAEEGASVKQLLLRGAESVLREPGENKVPRLRAPILNKGKQGTLKINNRKIYELIGFP
jgi:hypothetical protein